eukprot:673524-Prymnesium_polylepis.1
MVRCGLRPAAAGGALPSRTNAFALLTPIASNHGACQHLRPVPWTENHAPKQPAPNPFVSVGEAFVSVPHPNTGHVFPAVPTLP